MLDTRTETLNRMTAAGSSEDVVVDDGGLRAVPSGRRYDPEALRVVETVRFEGDTDPGDEAIVLALASLDGRAVGTYTLPYGAVTDPSDAAVLDRLARPQPA
jgi:hypothetical protein